MSKSVLLGEILDVQNGFAFDSKNFSPSAPIGLIRIRDLRNGTVTETGYAGSYDPAYLVHAGDFLIGMDGEFRCYTWRGAPALLNQRVCRLHKFRSDVDPRYVFYGINAHLERIEAETGYTTVKHLSSRTIKEIEFYLPPLAEQQRIVAKLDEVEAEILRLEDVAERSREASDELFHRFMEDQLAELYSSHPVRRIGDVLAVARGGSPRPISAFLTSSSDGVNWVKISDATASRKYIYETAEKIKPEGVSRSRLVTSGDFLLSNSMSFGRPYIMRTTGCIHDGWLVLSDNEKQFDEDYLFQLFSSRRLYSEFSKRAQGSTVSNLNSALVSDVSIPIPPIKVQKAFAAQAGEIEADVNRLTELTITKASKLKDLRAAALAAAFRGDL